MKPLTPQEFYGIPLVHNCGHSRVRIQAEADNLKTLIFKALKFPVRVREMASKIMKVRISHLDTVKFEGKTVDDILKCAGVYGPGWRERIVSEREDRNVVVESTLKVRRIRSGICYLLDGMQYHRTRRHHGFEIVVKIRRQRCVGAS